MTKKRVRYPKVGAWVVALRQLEEADPSGEHVTHCRAGEIGRVVDRRFVAVGRPMLAVRWPSGSLSLSFAGEDVARVTHADVPRLARIRVTLAELAASRVVDLRLLQVLRDMEAWELALSVAS